MQLAPAISRLDPAPRFTHPSSPKNETTLTHSAAPPNIRPQTFPNRQKTNKSAQVTTTVIPIVRLPELAGQADCLAAQTAKRITGANDVATSPPFQSPSDCVVAVRRNLRISVWLSFGHFQKVGNDVEATGHVGIGVLEKRRLSSDAATTGPSFPTCISSG